MAILNSEKLFDSDLWLDQKDADHRIDAQTGSGNLTHSEAEKLRQFSRDGYFTIHIDEDELLDQVDLDVERIWTSKPIDLAFAYTGDLTSMADSDEKRDRRPRYRISDLHSHSDAAEKLYLHSTIHRWVGLVFGAHPVAFQSLYFQFGSAQSYHRDPVYVVTTPPSHLMAAWIALEDIGPDCGPLRYIRGSHKVPYYEFEPDRIAIRPGEDYMGAYELTMQVCRQRGLEAKEFGCKKGDVFFWHGSLVHRGSPPNDTGLTRKSLVIHFSTRKNYRKRSATFFKETADGPLEINRTTNRLLQRDGAVGFDNPLRGFTPPRVRLRNRLRLFTRRALTTNFKWLSPS